MICSKFKTGPKAAATTTANYQSKMSLTPFSQMVYDSTTIGYSYPTPPPTGPPKPAKSNPTNQKRKSLSQSKPDRGESEIKQAPFSEASHHNTPIPHLHLHHLKNISISQSHSRSRQMLSAEYLTTRKLIIKTPLSQWNNQDNPGQRYHRLLKSPKRRTPNRRLW